MRSNHVCGFYYVVGAPDTGSSVRRYLPQVDLSVHTTIISSTSRTLLRQKFVNPSPTEPIPELRYTFPLYDGVSVVAFKCTINDERVIKGVVKERHKARQEYQEAVDRGKVAALLEQLPDASDVFTTTVGNVPAGARLDVEIAYLGELKHDAEVDGVRFTIPTNIAPRYGSYPGELLASPPNAGSGKIDIVVDAEMPAGCNITSVQSPSHPISVSIGTLSTAAGSAQEPSLRRASATLALGSAELDKDFVVQVVASNTGEPIAVLETHPTIPSHRALMTTLVPKFNLPSSRPEIVFICDRSGSMGTGDKIPNLKAAVQLFLRSLPVGVKFNICSFGSSHSFLFPDGSRSYDKSSLDEALRHVAKFDANFGGTEMYNPLEATFQRRYKDMDLEVFLLTDGEIWNQARVFGMVNKHVADSKGAIRVMTLGIGRDVSHSLIEGLARAGNGFAQSVGENERMNAKVIRMLKASLMPHVTDYTLEVHYGGDDAGKEDSDDWEVVEKVMEGLTVDVKEVEEKEETAPSKTTSLYDPNVKEDTVRDTAESQNADNKHAQVPPVDHPKLLQAPFRIPPLFPFNRTTVYLLLSPETCQKSPRSITLTGTSKHGPLRLDVPITVLSEKGETIHQLAARKAVQELEEDRGWIFHAKDASGTLLKDKFEGRFSDMVEREGVRLGVQYQVANRWASFVAVEEDDDKAQPKKHSRAKSPTLAEESKEEEDDDDDDGEAGFCLYDDFAQPTAQMQALAPPPPMPMPAPGGPPVQENLRVESASVDVAITHARMVRRRSPAAAFAGMIQSASSKVLPSRRKAKKVAGGAPSGSVQPDAENEEEEADEHEEEALHQDPLQALIVLQSFEGYWTHSDKLVELLGVAEKNMEATFANDKDATAKNDVGVTVFVVACLRKRFAKNEDEWEMLVEKAMDWLREQVGPAAERLVQKAELLFAESTISPEFKEAVDRL